MADDPDQHRGIDPLARFDQELDRLEVTLTHLPPIPELQAAVEEVRAELPGLRGRRQTVERALVVVLLGGTGVGKSTVLNAIAGRGIARVSRDVRPCTRDYTVYAPAGVSLDFLAPLTRHDDVVVHQDEGLTGKVLIDCPDLDSTEAANRDKLLQLLPHADLVVMVVTREKYKDEALYQVLEAQLEARQAAFVVLANQQDRDGPGYLDDLRAQLEATGLAPARIFPVSAMEAFVAKQGGDTLPAPWAAFEGFLREELSRSHVRELKRIGLIGTLAKVRRRLALASARAVGSVPGLRRELEAASGSLADDLLSRLSASLQDSREVIGRLLLNRMASALGGPFGLWMQIERRLRHMLSPAGIAVAGVSQLSPLHGLVLGLGYTAVREVKERREEGAILSREAGHNPLVDAGLEGRFIARVRELRQEYLRCGIQPPVDHDEIEFPTLARNLARLYARGLDAELDRAASRLRAPWLSFALNVMPVALMAYTSIIVVRGLLAGVTPEINFYVAVGAVLVLACAVQGMGLRWAAHRTGRSLLDRVSGQVLGQARLEVDLLLAPMARTLDEVEALARTLPAPAPSPDGARRLPAPD